jgi:peptidoglycan/xylan/chitin deacetylase (PgdA/CDA1 family)
MREGRLTGLRRSVQRRVDLTSHFFRALDLLQVDRVLLRRLRQQRSNAVLNLHRVSPHDNPFWPPLHPRVFELVLRRLARGFEIVSLAALRSPSPSGSKPRLALSFDDGYQDFVEYALPVLHRLGIPANQNIIPDCVESGVPPWNIRLYDFLNAVPCTLINELAIPGFKATLRGDDVNSKLVFGGALSRFLKLRSRAEREALWPNIQRAMDRAGDFARVRMMSRADVVEFAGLPGSLVGAHSFSHDSMAFESDEFFNDDLGRCFAYFREQLGTDLTTYAFPNGSFRPRHVEMLQARGIRHILLVEEKLTAGQSDVVPRLTIGGRTTHEAYLRSIGFGARGAM